MDAFALHHGTKDGRQLQCRECHSESYYRSKTHTPHLGRATQEERDETQALYLSGKKQCCRCRAVLPFTNEFFYEKDTGKDGLDGTCKACHVERTTKRMQSGPTKVYYDAWRTAGCAVCGCTHIICIEAHHRDPAGKEYTFRMSLPLDVLRIELAKCVPICANHHRALHYELHNGGKDLPFDDLLALVREKYPA